MLCLPSLCYAMLGKRGADLRRAAEERSAQAQAAAAAAAEAKQNVTAWTQA